MPVINFTGTIFSVSSAKAQSVRSLSKSVTRILLVTEYRPPPLYMACLMVSSAGTESSMLTVH